MGGGSKSVEKKGIKRSIWNGNDQGQVYSGGIKGKGIL